MSPQPHAVTLLDERVRRLVHAFEQVGATRMAGVPVLHPGLRVEAVGFAALADDEGGEPGDAALGVLVTPWFMNLVWLPLHARAAASGLGETRTRTLGGHAFEFIGALEPQAGAYELCSLFSPMFEFTDQAAARATAQSVLDLLRAPPPSPPAAPPGPARRGFLFGRSAAAPAR